MREGSDVSEAGLDAVGSVALRADSLLFSLAQTTEELEQAYRLVYRNYLRAEYIDAHPSEMRYSRFNVLPSTATFVARLRDTVVTTASIVFDSPLGLPMEIIYHDEIEELRATGARLCEVTMLADRRRAGMRTIPAILQLFKLVLHYAMHEERATDIVITINPSHEGFYTRYLPFDDLAGLRYYPAVKNAPALAKFAHLADLSEESKWRRLFEFFMGSQPRLELLTTKKQFTEDELRELFVIRRDVLQRLSAEELDHVRACYGDCDFDQILAPTER